MNYSKVDHNECNNEIQPILIPIALGPAISSISLTRDGTDGTAIWFPAAISDGQPWRDGTSRDPKPRDDHYLLTWTSIGSLPSVRLSRKESFLLPRNIYLGVMFN